MGECDPKRDLHMWGIEQREIGYSEQGTGVSSVKVLKMCSVVSVVTSV